MNKILSLGMWFLGCLVIWFNVIDAIPIFLTAIFIRLNDK